MVLIHWDQKLFYTVSLILRYGGKVLGGALKLKRVIETYGSQVSEAEVDENHLNPPDINAKVKLSN